MSLGCLGTGGTVHADACAVLHDITHETGTVHTGTRVIAACTVRSTHKLKGVVHEILAGIGCCFRCLGCRCLCCCQLFFQLLCRLDLGAGPLSSSESSSVATSSTVETGASWMTSGSACATIGFCHIKPPDTASTAAMYNTVFFMNRSPIVNTLFPNIT